jgi:hypothetical protein
MQIIDLTMQVSVVIYASDLGGLKGARGWQFKRRSNFFAPSLPTSMRKEIN